MEIWTPKLLAAAFKDKNSRNRIYSARYTALKLVVGNDAERIKENLSKKNNAQKENFQMAMNGNLAIKRYSNLIIADTAAYLTLRNCTKDGKVDYKKLAHDLGDGKIDQEFVDRAGALNKDFQQVYQKLDRIRESCEANVLKVRAKGGRIDLDVKDMDFLEASMGTEFAIAAGQSYRKYLNWKNFDRRSKEATDDELSYLDGDPEDFIKRDDKSKRGFFFDSQSRVYKGVMNFDNNFLTLPVKLLFFSMHELFDGRSVLRRGILNPIGRLIKNSMLGIYNSVKARNELKKLGVPISIDDSPDEQVPEKKVYTKTIRDMQRTILKGYNLADDLKIISAEPVKESTEIILEDEQKDADRSAKAGSDEKPEVQKAAPKKVEKPAEVDYTKIQNQVSDVILRYNTLIYILMRAFSGTYGAEKAFGMFSILPYEIKDNPASMETNREEAKKAVETAKQFLNSDEAKKILGTDNMKTASSEKKNAISNMLQQRGVPTSWIDGNFGSVNGIFESQTLKSYVAMLKEDVDSRTAKKQHPYILCLTRGIGNVNKKDVMLSRLIQRNGNIRREMNKNARYSVFFAYAQLFEDILTEYSTYLTALEKYPQLNKIKDLDIKLTGIKSLKLIDCTNRMQKALTYISSNTSDSFRNELRKEYISLAMFKRITNITQFLTIHDMNFKNIQAFISMCLPKLKLLRKPTDTSCEITDEIVQKVFGDEGLIPFSAIDSRTKKAKKEVKEFDKEKAKTSTKKRFKDIGKEKK